MQKLSFILFVLGLATCYTAQAETKMPQNSALIVVTSHAQLGDTGKKTGWFLSEVTHIYYPLVKAGYKVDFSSPQGGAAPMDESSRDLVDADNKRFVEDKALMTQIQNTAPLSKVNPANYQIIHFAGGTGAMWDFADNADMNRLVSAIYDQGGIVSAICHGPAALINIKLKNGEYFVKGKNISAFTDAEEAEVGRTNIVPFLLETELKERGAKVISAKNWADQSVVSDRLVTGQNPQSGHSVAKKILETAQKSKK